ncbi:MAG: hypothetical protein EA356_05565 [Geminicoccaceae bacterium]|nr:MAG: hypothetical protein EA356_05565 [Geminicoccaceae bacterium]
MHVAHARDLAFELVEALHHLVRAFQDVQEARFQGRVARVELGQEEAGGNDDAGKQTDGGTGEEADQAAAARSRCFRGRVGFAP